MAAIITPPCDTCGAAVTDTIRHTRWHHILDTELTRLAASLHHTEHVAEHAEQVAENMPVHPADPERRRRVALRLSQRIRRQNL